MQTETYRMKLRNQNCLVEKRIVEEDLRIPGPAVGGQGMDGRRNLSLKTLRSAIVWQDATQKHVGSKQCWRKKYGSVSHLKKSDTQEVGTTTNCRKHKRMLTKTRSGGGLYFRMSERARHRNPKEARSKTETWETEGKQDLERKRRLSDTARKKTETSHQH